MLKIRSDRTFKIAFEDGDISFKVTFKFPFIEEMDMGKLRETFKDVKDEKSAVNPTLGILRSCIVAIEDIVDEETNEPMQLEKDGVINETVQKVVFEYLRHNPKWLDSVLTAYLGPRGKNLSAGVTPQ